MKLFLDANVLVSVLNKEYPIFPYSSRILSLVSTYARFEVYTSPLCLAIAFYFAEKKHGTKLAKQKIDLLCQHIQIAENLKEGVLQTLSNKKIHDFEDGLEYYAAKANHCDCIITEDINDFYFSEIEVLNCKRFFDQYLSKL
ncbi:PIN domain-containing protein [Pedobacter sp. Hv1]|uniref:PIN domain-containing protein n=1 Tax=Pedobacter sp. Hv1 TaxID=1740090 RepID=UPI0006D896FB|nr:PIN domain-containing protein [Pedobacter sp. Hv1]KQC00784.1 twitching motility protein PilT [Pedobacter sp. Hv1]